MSKFTARILAGAIVLSGYALTVTAKTFPFDSFDPGQFRYSIDSSTVFHNRKAQETKRLNSIIDGSASETKDRNVRYSNAFRNPEPLFSFPEADIIGDLEAPGGEMWSYVGKFEYLEIPPHDNVVFTERLLQEYTFTIYDADMKLLGTIKDKIHYKDGEKRAPYCELTPVVTRNFFNTDDDLELMVAVGINPADYPGVHYHSYVYTLGAEKDDDGYDKPIMEFTNLVGDII